MRPIEFPEQTTVFAKNQPEYAPLPAWADGQEVITCWRPTLGERFRLLFGGNLWLRQLTFGHPLQPVALQASDPFDRSLRIGGITAAYKVEAPHTPEAGRDATTEAPANE